MSGHQLLSAAGRNSAARQPRRQWGLLLAIGLVIAEIWLGVLPKLAQHPAIRQRQALFRAKGIDPAAMFYTELELLDSPHNRLRQWQHQHPDALWYSSWAVPCEMLISERF